MKTVKERYLDNYKKYGKNDERSLGWTKDKKEVRYEQLFRFLEPSNGSVLDIGCGFGDMYTYIKKEYANSNISYYGVDIMQEFIEIAVMNHPENKDNFRCVDFYDDTYVEKYDYCVASGIFAYAVCEDEEGMYNYIKEMIEKGLKSCNVGIAFNFLSDKVDYRGSKEDFFASPEKILSIAYGFSRRVILDNSIMPFEFTLTIFKDDSFSKDTTIFNTVS